jgi:hypothetical protein
LRYPDIVVDRAGGGAKDHTATAPVLLVEVLSPSTAATDLGDKAAEYLQIPSLVAYIVLSQDEPKAWVWARAIGEFAPGPVVIAGTEAIIRIAALRRSNEKELREFARIKFESFTVAGRKPQGEPAALTTRERARGGLPAAFFHGKVVPAPNLGDAHILVRQSDSSPFWGFHSR